MTSQLLQDAKDINRVKQIAFALAKYEFNTIVAHLGLTNHVKSEEIIRQRSAMEDSPKNLSQPEKVVRIFEELGGTFIKLGQLLSIRPDLLPQEYCDAFRKLQDNVAPFPTSKAIELIEHELKCPLHHVFYNFDTKPIASASIGQVYGANLKKGGKRVAIKVQRPGIRELFATDIDILHRIASAIQKKYQPQMFDPIAIVKEFERYTKEELSYVKEGQNIDHFYRHFRSDPTTIIPKVHWESSTDRVLTMDFIDGIKISELPKNTHPATKKRIVRRVVESIYKQIFEHGFFHADPHPGNILVLKNIDGKEGKIPGAKGFEFGERIAFLDFGITGCFDDDLREQVVGMFTGMMTADLDRTARAMIGLGFVRPTADTARLKRNLVASLGRYYDRPIEEFNFGEAFNELITVAKANNIVLPTDLVLLGKAIVTVNGFARDLDPSFNLVEFSKPFVRRYARERIYPHNVAKRFIRTTTDLKGFISAMPRQTNILLERLETGQKSIGSIDNDIRVMVRELDRSSNRVAIGLLITAFAIASALLFTAEQPEFQGMPLFSMIGFSFCAVLLAILFFSIIRERGVAHS